MAVPRMASARTVAVAAVRGASMPVATSMPARTAPTALLGARFATGPAASATTISDELLEKLSKLSTQVQHFLAHLVTTASSLQKHGGQFSKCDLMSIFCEQALIDGLWVMGWPSSFIEGAR